MKKIKFIKNTPDGVMKEGDISNASPKNADFAVRTGYAIYEGEEKKSLSEELKNFQSRAEEISTKDRVRLGEYFNIKKLEIELEFICSKNGVIPVLRYISNELEKGVFPTDILIDGVNKLSQNCIKKKYLNELFKRQVEQEQKILLERRKDLEMPEKPQINFFVANYIQNIQTLYEKQPFFFDVTNQFWMWDTKKFKYVEIDDIDLMNILDVAYNSASMTLDSSTKGKYMEAFKRIGRQNNPIDLPKEWIQFKNKLFNIQTKEIKEVSPDYFLTNPLPWEIGNSDNCPTIEKLFNEWVGKKYIKTLYEVIAYCCYRDYPIHLCFTLVGSGRNGKSQFQRLLCKFLGEDNTSTTDLDIIIGNRFETIKCYKKLAVLMGETNFGVMEKTSMLKKLSGGDKIGFEKKNKNPFDDYNYGKLIINSNSLPSSDDTSEGFYRRWLIINFPNDFPEGKDIFLTVPEIEFNNLARKIVGLLPELIEHTNFTNQGSVQERKERYIEYSNPLPLFLNEMYEVDYEGYISYGYMYKNYCQFLIKRKMRVVSREEFSKALTREGYEYRKTSKKIGEDYINDRWIEGLRLKFGTLGTFVTQPHTSIPSRAYKVEHESQVSQVSQKPPQNEEIIETNSKSQDIKTILSFIRTKKETPKPNEEVVLACLEQLGYDYTLLVELREKGVLIELPARHWGVLE